MVGKTFGRDRGTRGHAARSPESHFFAAAHILGPGDCQSPRRETGQPGSLEVRSGNVIDGEMIISPPRFLFGIELPTRLQLKNRVLQQGHDLRPLSDGGGYKEPLNFTVVSKVDCRRVSQNDRRHAERRRQRSQDCRNLQLRVAVGGHRLSSSISTKSVKITRFGNDSCYLVRSTSNRRATFPPASWHRGFRQDFRRAGSRSLAAVDQPHEPLESGNRLFDLFGADCFHE